MAAAGTRRLDTCRYPVPETPGKNEGIRVAGEIVSFTRLSPIAPGIGGVSVYYRIFDVDDPFDQIHGPGGANDVPNVNVIDHDDDGNDNFGAASGVGSRYAHTNEYGMAFVTLTVSRSPGDNYRAAASCISDAVYSPPESPPAQVRQDDADALSTNGNFAGYQVPAVWSKMLTVWRKLWVERDTMLAPDPTELRFVGPILGIYPTSGRPGLTTVLTTFSIGFNGDLNNYEEGTVTFTSCPSGADTFPVVESYAGSDFSPSKLIVLGTPGACAAVDTGLTLYDDDDPSALGTPSNPHFPDGGTLLTSAFAPAYILPVYAGAEHRDVVEFDDYVSALQVYSGAGWNNGHDLSSTSDFWSGLIVGAWEGSDDLSELSSDGDGDPDECFNLFAPPEAREGAEAPLTGVRRPFSRQALVFLQALADEAACVDQTDEAHTVVHEIGHTSGVLPHKDGTIMEEGAPKNQSSFDAQQLDILRSQNLW